MIYCHIIGTHLGNSGREGHSTFEKDLREMDPSSVEGGREREGERGGNFKLRASIGFVLQFDHENVTKVQQGGNERASRQIFLETTILYVIKQ